jgi:TPR repeat protein
MIRRILAFAFVSLCLSADYGAAAEAKADNAPVVDCDTYGANSVDPDRKAPGVNFVELNAAIALPACEAAAQQYPDSTRFIYQLGRAYHKANRFADAAAWYQKAMERGSPFAEAGLALLYMTGQGVAQDYSKAATMFREAADKGVLGAQNAMGILYSKGWGVPQDNVQAIVWYRKAAEGNAPNAEINLGIAYENGLGVEKNLDQAAAWYRKAADQGIDVAKKMLEDVEAKIRSQAK